MKKKKNKKKDIPILWVCIMNLNDRKEDKYEEEEK